MVLQNESVDEDLEHFEDIVEEADTEPSSKMKKDESDIELANGKNDDANSEEDSSEDEEETPASDSEEDVSDGSEEFLIKDNSKDLHKTETQSAQVKPQTDVSKKSSLPGGYDPRHREPSYWYLSF